MLAPGSSQHLEANFGPLPSIAPRGVCESTCPRFGSEVDQAATPGSLRRGSWLTGVFAAIWRGGWP